MNTRDYIRAASGKVGELPLDLGQLHALATALDERQGKNCKLWDRSYWSDYGEGVLECVCLRVAAEVGVTSETGGLLKTHPDFGCVHFEPKEQ